MAEIREDANGRHQQRCGHRQRALHQDHRPHQEADKVEWEWISLVNWANALIDHNQVCEAPVIAVPHEQWTEYPLAVVVPLEAAKLSAEELGEYLSGNFAKWWLPDAYEFVDQLPRTSTGKF